MSMRVSTMRNLRSSGFAIAFIVLLGVAGIYGASEPAGSITEQQVFPKIRNYARKLLTSNSTSDEMDRIGRGDQCTKDSIVLIQNQTAPLPSGIPTYTVDIENVCLFDKCNIGGIHVRCGWFSSARLINPKIFRRLAYDDCLVNDGNPIGPGEVVTFAYANTYLNPMSVKVATCAS